MDRPTVHGRVAAFDRCQRRDLYGVNVHVMRPGQGYAISDADTGRDVAMIEELGATVIRFAHYQHPQRIYDLADRRGLAGWIEIPAPGHGHRRRRVPGNTKAQLLAGRVAGVQCRCWGSSVRVTGG